jgi:hypothetical protein
MTNAQLRKMSVRDDGSGRRGAEEVRFDDLNHEDAIIILGDPGMGKTTLMREVAGASYVKVRQFIAAPFVPPTGIVYLDSLDEYRRTAGDRDVAVEIAKILTELNKPKFRLSCRAADWLGSLDQEMLRAASSSGRVVVLELLPLTDEEIVGAVTSRVPDPDTFVAEAREAGLGGLLRNPQTLGLVAEAWGGSKRPRNKFEAYELGISALLKEANPGHILRGAQPDNDALRDAAGAVASALLLSDLDEISRVDCVDSDDCADLSDIPYKDKPIADAALKRRVFTSTRDDCFEFVHRTIQEFLAADDLSRRIEHGLPIDRVLALMCGLDGSPVSSLRGLYAWLVCKLPDRAKAYVDRDPYAVATYGDASVLAPDVQRALWHSLRQLHDPWFLSGEDRGEAFKRLANRNTAPELLAILRDPASSPHLQVAVLEAISYADEDLGLLDAVLKAVLQPNDNVWLRSVALKAYVHLARRDPVAIAKIDRKLSARRKDCHAAEVRVELLLLTIDDPKVADRALAVLGHVVACGSGSRTYGRVSRLGKKIPDSEIESVLNGAHRVLKGIKDRSYEVESLFATLLVRRLKAAAPIKPTELAKWLRSLLRNRDHDQALLAELKVRLAQKPDLLSELFSALARQDEASFVVFVAHHLWRVLPAAIWPITPSVFFLDRAQREPNTRKAAELFRMYIAWFPEDGGTVALAEAGFDLVRDRPKLAKELGKWSECQIEKWREENWERSSRETAKREEVRAATIKQLTPRLADIAAGNYERALVWATGIYFGFYIDVDGKTPSDRFRNAANSEIEDACMQGFVQFLERKDIPTRKEVIESWCGNQIPYLHATLCLSLYLRDGNGLDVPTHALPACIAAALTSLTGDKVAGFEDRIKAWYLRQAVANPCLMKSVLVELWLSTRGLLPGFHELARDESLQSFVADVSAQVLRSPTCDDYTTRTLVPTLLKENPSAIQAIAPCKLADPCVTSGPRGVWLTAVYLVSPINGLSGWRSLQSEPDDALWEAIELIGGVNRAIMAQERGEIISMIGRRFAPASFPPNGWSGHRNAWDASSFVGRQIEMLAADTSDEASTRLESLENDPSLVGYRDLIRHNRQQQIRQRRELSFAVPTAKQVRQTLLNSEPASSNDLLAYIIDHIEILSRELAHTQKERYRAYWNEKGRTLVSPKYEEVCSGILAADLQSRVRQHGLIVTVEHHMVKDKECDLVVLQGPDRLLPIEVKHHFHAELWTAWRSQLEALYMTDVTTGGRGIYLILWSGIAAGRRLPKPPDGVARPTSPEELRSAIESLIPRSDRNRLRVSILDIGPP